MALHDLLGSANVGVVLIGSSRAGAPGFDDVNDLASVWIEPVIYELGDELTLRVEIVNRSGRVLGIGFGEFRVDRDDGGDRDVIAHVNAGFTDAKLLVRSGIRQRLEPLLELTRARFALGTLPFRLEPGACLVVHSEPFASALVEELEAKAERWFGLLPVIRVLVATEERAELLVELPEVCLPKPHLRRPRPPDATLLSPAVFDVVRWPEREAALARRLVLDAADLDDDEAVVIGVRGEQLDGLGLVGFDRDDAELQPLHVRALDEYVALLGRAPELAAGLRVAVTGYADCHAGRVSSARARELAKSRAEAVAARLTAVPGLEVSTRNETDCRSDEPLRRRVELHGLSKGPRGLIPMINFPWPGAPNVYALDEHFPILAAAWGIERLTLARLRAVYRRRPWLAAMLVPDRVRGEPRREALVGAVQLRRLRDQVARAGPPTPTLPTGHAIAKLVEPFGMFMPWLAHLLEMIRAYRLAPEQVRDTATVWVMSVLEVVVDAWQPPEARGPAALNRRLRAITNETELVPALVLVLAARAAWFDALREQLGRAEHALALASTLEQLRSEDGRAAWIAEQRQLRAAAARPDLDDIVASFDAGLAALLRALPAP